MTEFERELVNAFNRFFDTNTVNAIAYRRKQHRFSSQFCDILVDSIHPEYYLAIENKSISTRATNKLYFSQHFTDNELHQVDRITNFLNKSGRTGYLAVEVKRGHGKPRKAFLIPWNHVHHRFTADETGIHLDELDQFTELDRNATDYTVEQVFHNGPDIQHAGN